MGPVAWGWVLVLAGHPCPVPSARLSRLGGSNRLALHLHVEVGPPACIRSPDLMIKDIARRSRRIALTLAPLAAIALTLAAGLKWH